MTGDELYHQPRITRFVKSNLNDKFNDESAKHDVKKKLPVFDKCENDVNYVSGHSSDQIEIGNQRHLLLPNSKLSSSSCKELARNSNFNERRKLKGHFLTSKTKENLLDSNLQINLNTPDWSSDKPLNKI